MRPLFITGTDTEIGKTYVSVGLLKAFHRMGLSTIGLKPIAAGCFLRDEKLYNDDALLRQKASSIELDYDLINPFAFQAPIAPHLAAKQIQCELSVKKLNQKMRGVLNTPVDICLIEGLGGWMILLNETEFLADFVLPHHFNVILVIGIRLGCINHGLLTWKALRQDGANVIGWIADCIDPHLLYRDENIATLKNHLPIPCLGVVQYGEKPEEVIDVNRILNFSGNLKSPLHNGCFA